VPSEDDVKPAAGKAASGKEVYTIAVNGQSYVVEVSEGGDITGMVPVKGGAPAATAAAAPASKGEPVPAPLAGNIFRVLVAPGQAIKEGDLLIVLEAMKMETEIRAPHAGTVGSINVKVGDSVAVGDILMTL
jgi:oxaloacetate decarboxylase alpha subunit